MKTMIELLMMLTLYVDGVSITYGNTPRKHIWTYAGGTEDTAHNYINQNDRPCKQILLLSLHHNMLVLTTTVSLLLVYAAQGQVTYYGMDSRVVVARLHVAHIYQHAMVRQDTQ